MAQNEMIVVETGDGGQDPMIEAAPEDNLSTHSASDDEMGVRHCFYDFCKQTILHGWHYLADIESHPTPSASFVGTGGYSFAGMLIAILCLEKLVF